MKTYAIACDNGYVSAHFGRCPEYVFVSIQNGQVIQKQKCPNPGHAIGTIPQFIHQNHADFIICGGMGARAQQLFSEFGIETIMGVQMSLDATIQKIIDGTLSGSFSLCNPRSGRNYGIPRSDEHSHSHN